MREDEKLVLEFCIGNQLPSQINYNIFSEIYNRASLNKIEQILIEELSLKENCYKNKTILSKLNEEKDKRAIYEKILYEVLIFFENENIRAIPIKSIYPFPYVDADLDIVIIDDDFRSLKDRLIKIGYKDYKSPKREPFKHFFIKEKNRYPLIHIHRQLSWNGIIILDKFQLWEKSVTYDMRYGRIKKPSNEFDILIAVAHCMFENFFITGNDILLFSMIKDINWTLIMDQAKKFNWSTGLYTYLKIINTYYQYIINNKIIENKVMNSLSKGVLFPDREIGLKHLVLPSMIEVEYIFLPIIEKLFKDGLRFKTSSFTRELIFLFGLNYLLFMRNRKKIL